MSATIHVWSGYHSDSFRDLFSHCATHDELLICCPPLHQDFSFLEALPEGPIQFYGVAKQERSSWGTYPERPILGVFTTGSTRSTPKLVLYTKENLLNGQEGIWEFFQSTAVEALFCMPQPFHVFGLLLGYRMSFDRKLKLITGTGAYSQDHQRAWLDCPEPKLMTLGTPVHFYDLISQTKIQNRQPRPTSTCIIGGARVERYLWHQCVSELNIEHPTIGYGCTEASPGVTHLPPGHAPRADGAVGFGLKDLVLKIGPEGLAVSGPSVAMATVESGNIQLLNSQLLISDSLIQTDDGAYLFQGRLDDVLNRGGQKFPLGDLEQVIFDHLGVQSICVALDHPRLGQELGVLAQNAATPISRKALVECLTLKTGRSFLDMKLRSIEELPINSSSKLDRKVAKSLLV